MITGATLLTVLGAFPLIIATTNASHEYSMLLVGVPALAMTVAALAFCVIYALGFLNYCSSKGYSKWLGMWLLLCNIPGTVVLLLLPDLHEISNAPCIGLHGISKEFTLSN